MLSKDLLKYNVFKVNNGIWYLIEWRLYYNSRLIILLLYGYIDIYPISKPYGLLILKCLFKALELKSTIFIALTNEDYLGVKPKHICIFYQSVHTPLEVFQFGHLGVFHTPMLSIKGKIRFLLSFLISRPYGYSFIGAKFMYQFFKDRVKLFFDDDIKLSNGFYEILAAVFSHFFELL